MSKAQHAHTMAVIAWTTRPQGDELAFAPAVLMACVKGVCAKTEVVRPAPRSRKVPEGLTDEEFKALKGGAYWPEIHA